MSLQCLAERGGRCTSRSVSGSPPLLEQFLRSRSRQQRDRERTAGQGGWLCALPVDAAPQALGLLSSGPGPSAPTRAILGSDPLPLAGSSVWGPFFWNVPPCSYCWHRGSARRPHAKKGPVSPCEGASLSLCPSLAVPLHFLSRTQAGRGWVPVWCP